MDKLTAFASVSANPPTIPAEFVRQAVREQFDLDGEYTLLVSERDQNFHLQTTSGRQYLVKVTSAAEPAIVSDFHLGVLLHLEAAGTTSTPHVVRTSAAASAGRIEHDREAHVLRVVSYLEGTPLSEVSIDTDVARDFGTELANLDAALQGFRHPGEHPLLLWDLQRAVELRELAHHIDSESTARAVALAIDDFERNVVPKLASLRRQVVHGDANPGNVLFDESGGIRGFIDFGDSVNAPLIFDVAIASSYLRSVEPLALIGPFIAAYHAVLPVRADELEILFDLVRARLATTISILFWRLAERDTGDAYREKTLQTEGEAIHFLDVLDALGRDDFVSTLRSVTGAD
ncbi:MAG: phosphotransferase [Woeseiaceae bacterium]